MKLLDRLSDRALAFATAGVFVALGLDLAVIDVIPFLDEALLATASAGMASAVMQRRRARKAAVKAEAEADEAAG